MSCSRVWLTGVVDMFDQPAKEQRDLTDLLAYFQSTNAAAFGGCGEQGECCSCCISFFPAVLSLKV